MIKVIAEAIKAQQTLCFIYKGQERCVEPHTYGRSLKGYDAICAWQGSGGSGVGYRLFKADELTGLSMGDQFAGPRPSYTRCDSRFSLIYAEL